MTRFSRWMAAPVMTLGLGFGLVGCSSEEPAKPMGGDAPAGTGSDRMKDSTPGGAMEGDKMKGGAMEGDKMKGGAMEGDKMKGGAMEGDKMKDAPK